jgi:hypothetical protein
MSAAVPGRCFFLDSCVALAEILGENKEVMEKFKTDVNRRGIQCYLSDSAAAECERKLNFSQTFFERVFQNFAEVHFSECRKQLGMKPYDPLCKEDYLIFASLFTELRKAMSPILSEPLRTLEIKMVLALEELLRKGGKIEFSSFLREVIAQAMLLAANLKIQKVKYITNEQGFFKKKNIVPDNATSERLLTSLHHSKYYPFHKDDADNISSAWAYRQSTKEDTVFVTFDFRSILFYAEEIFKVINLRCADPLYAVHFFLTRR